jgi:hypothetical protein
MKERPILFSATMVQAILASRKTQTRRIIKPQPVHVVPFVSFGDGIEKPTGEFGLCMKSDRVIEKHVRCPYGQRGDRLWVKETWNIFHRQWDEYNQQEELGAPFRSIPKQMPKNGILDYAADWSGGSGYRPSIHMPRWASRITLEVVSVRVERLQQISVIGATAEGVTYEVSQRPIGPHHPAILAYQELWERINGKGSWAANPWVWVVEFKHIQQKASV